MTRARKGFACAIALAAVGLACDFRGSGLQKPQIGPNVERADSGAGARDGAAPTGAGGTPAPGTGGTNLPVGPGASPVPPDDGSAPETRDGGPADDAGMSVATGIPVRGDAGTVGEAGAADAGGTPPPVDPAARKATCPADDSLLLCLRFENDLLDESLPRAYVTGDRLMFEPGITGLAVRGGADTLVRAESGLGAVGRSFTAEAWIRVDRFPAAGARAGVIDKQLHFGMFVQPNGDLACTAYGATVTAPAAVTRGVWTAVACRVDSTTLTVWINGKSRDEARVVFPVSLGPDMLAVGSNQPSGDPLHGLIDNVRVWNRTREAAQICEGALGC